MYRHMDLDSEALGPTPRFSSVTYGKHSLRYLGSKLCNDLTPTTIRNLPSLKQFKSVIRNEDLTALAANVSDCPGCNFCREYWSLT